MSLNFQATRFQCTWPWEMLVMLCDGRIVCGCADPLAKRVLGDEAFLCRTRDISQNAMRLRRVLEPARPQREMTIEFQLPGQEEVIWAQGEVIREPGDQAMVVRFTSLTDHHRSLIDGYVRQSRRNARRTSRIL